MSDRAGGELRLERVQNMRDLITDEPFTKKDIITLQVDVELLHGVFPY